MHCLTKPMGFPAWLYDCLWSDAATVTSVEYYTGRKLLRLWVLNIFKFLSTANLIILIEIMKYFLINTLIKKNQVFSGEDIVFSFGLKQ